jgi:transglutaminase-like putative cysteine protease
MAPPGAARFALTHRTSYAFDRAVGLAPHEIRLRPAPHARAIVSAYSLAVLPEAHTLHWQQDAYANWVARLTFPAHARELALRVELAGALVDVNPFDFFVEPDAARFPFTYAPAVQRALGPYLARPDAGGPRLGDWVRAFGGTVADDEPTVSMLVRVNRLLREDIDYRVREEAGVQSAESTLAQRIGSCRDSAWLLIQVLRALGIAARFVSGYLVELASGPGTRDAGSLHAWAEAFVPGAGWIGLDPTSGLLASSGHVPLACAADPEMAAPVTGTTDVCNVTFHASIDVRSVAGADAALR